MVVGMLVTLGGVAWVIRERSVDEHGREIGVDAVGVGLGVLAAACQAVGTVLTKLAGEGHSALSVSIIRLAAGTVGLLLMAVVGRRLGRIVQTFRDRRSTAFILLAAFLGTYLGIWLMNAGFLLTHVGVAATLNSTSPIFALPLAAVFFREKLSFRSVVGAVVAVIGVALLFVNA